MVDCPSGEMYDHNKLLSLYQTNEPEAIRYLDENIWYFLERVSWKISQYELDEMRSFAIGVIHEFAKKQLIKRDVILDNPEIEKIENSKIKKRAIDALMLWWSGKFNHPIQWLTSESNRIGRYLIVTLRGRLMNKAKVENSYNDHPINPDEIELDGDIDCISQQKTYNAISDAILSLNFNEQQTIWIHMNMIGWSSAHTCAKELWMDVYEFNKMMREVKYLIQQHIYDNTNTKASDREV